MPWRSERHFHHAGRKVSFTLMIMYQKDTTVSLCMHLSVHLQHWFLKDSYKGRRATGEIINKVKKIERKLKETVTNSSLSVALVCQFVTCLMSILETKVHVHKQQVTKHVGMKGNPFCRWLTHTNTSCSRPFTHICLKCPQMTYKSCTHNLVPVVIWLNTAIPA